MKDSVLLSSAREPLHYLSVCSGIEEARPRSGESVSKAAILLGETRAAAAATIRERHYTRSVPSGKSLYFAYEDALVVFSLPANKNISAYLVGEPNVAWELSRLWAPDGHRKNLLTQAIAASARELRLLEPTVTTLVSYADPNAGHLGGVYRAASWQYLGQSEETRMYKSGARILPRRAFHSGAKSMTKTQIEALGFTQMKMPGKHRFAKGLTAKARKRIEALAWRISA